MNEEVEMTLMEYEDTLNKHYNRFLDNLMTIRVGRANPRLIENIKVDYYGTRAPIMQTSNIVVADARMLVISPYDVSTLKDIKIGLEQANLGVSISDDGKIIRVGFPMLTEERRREYSKDAKRLLEDTKVQMRNARRDCLDVLKAAKKNGEITEDEYLTLDKDVQKKLDSFTGKADISCEKKIAEIMEV